MTHHAAALMTITVLRTHDAIRDRLRDQRGQGTVEYVGVILLVAGVLGAVVAWAKGKDSGIGETVTKQLQKAIDNTAAGKK